MGFEQLSSIFNFFLYPESFLWFLIIKLAFLLVSLIMLVLTIILFFHTSWAKRFLFEDFTETFTARPYGAKKALKEWVAIRKLIESKKEQDYKLAVIQADDLLEEILKKMGYKGENTSERLEQIDSSVLPEIKELIRVHKIRNNTVYDPDFKIDFETAKRALEVYEKSFRDLEVF